jgi:hypothetical protein
VDPILAQALSYYADLAMNRGWLAYVRAQVREFADGEHGWLFWQLPELLEQEIAARRERMRHGVAA